ncbi:MAG TPA: DNA translocase FtsK, partial [Cellvibrionaceae bacterium]|nr:DNA translocase FtsK [Cellvibrionaceae bacterium]
ARIAFRVTSKIDSRTILDTQGADQLIGRGDLLYTNGNDVVRVQCAFIDTPEVEKITEFIGSQKAYPDAYLLPEFIGEESGINLDIDISERDSLFREAAEIIVTAQQGSASLLQRKLKLGYGNNATNPNWARYSLWRIWDIRRAPRTKISLRKPIFNK